MVAPNTDFAASKPDTDTKNRVGRFFSLAAETVGEDRCSTRKCAREKRGYHYDIASVDPEFEYGPFGELIRATGSKKDDFNFRFSTKYEDAETGLYYYGFRYYDPETGRWPSRDPIEEEGGLNLYAMVGNNAVNYWDMIGFRKGRDKNRSLDEIEADYRSMVRWARARLYTVAAANLEHFLDGGGSARRLSSSWLRGFKVVAKAEEENRKRFLTKTLSPVLKGKSKTDEHFLDWWDSSWSSVKAGINQLHYASGGSTLTSYGDIQATCGSNGDFTLKGTVDHYWWDPYDWHAGLGANIPGFGNVSDRDGLKLKNAGRANEFWMDSIWHQSFDAVYNADTDSFTTVSWGPVTDGGSGAAMAVQKKHPSSKPKPIKDGSFPESDMRL